MNSVSTSNQPDISLAEKGFTLVELLIVVIILAILAAIVVPQFASTADDARSSSADSTLAGLRAAIDLYYQQHNNTYPGALTAVPTAACGGTSGTGVATGGAGPTATTAFMEQLTLYTDAAGGACSISDANNHRFGPYLKKADIPTDPFLLVSALEVINIGDLAMGATGGDPGGFKFDTTTGKIIITGHHDGEVRVGPIFDEDPHVLFGHAIGDPKIFVSPDGRWIASIGKEGTLHLWPMPDFTEPPFHALPYPELMTRLKALTNLRAVPDEESHTGYSIEPDFTAYRGWETVPTW